MTKKNWKFKKQTKTTTTNQPNISKVKTSLKDNQQFIRNMKLLWLSAPSLAPCARFN